MSDAALRRLEQTYPPIVSTAMVAEILGLNARTVLLMAQDGRLPASRIPGAAFVPVLPRRRRAHARREPATTGFSRS